MTRCFVPWAAVLLTFAGCGQPEKQIAPGDPADKPIEHAEPETAAADDQPPIGNVKLANPASTNCIDRGGELEMHTEPAGQFGVCIFDDGSRCEEWRYFRGECKPGECTEPTGKCE